MPSDQKILIANLASPENPGDQAILLGTLKMCREIAPSAQITLATRAYSQRSAYEEWNCKVVPSFPNVEHLAMEDGFKKWLHIPKALMDSSGLKEAVRESDLVLLAGGAYFYSYRNMLPGLTYLAHISPVYWARKFNRPLMMLPQSYGPFYSRAAEKLFSYSLESSVKVFYREEISGEYLRKTFPKQSSKFEYMPDLALFLEPADFKKTPVLSRNLVGVTVRPWTENGKDESGYLKTLEDALVWCVEKLGLGVRIIVQVQDEKKAEGDEVISLHLKKSLEARLPAEKLEFYSQKPFFRPEDLYTLYGECRLMISMRLHSALLSFIATTPALAAGYQHKAEGILKSLDLADLYLGSFSKIDPDKLRESLSKISENQSFYKDKIAKALETARSKIRKTMETFPL